MLVAGDAQGLAGRVALQVCHQGVEVRDGDAFGLRGAFTHELVQVLLLAGGEGARERGEQDPGFWLLPGQARCTVQSYDGLARACSAPHAGWPAVVAVDDFLLRRVEEDRPLVPWFG